MEGAWECKGWEDDWGDDSVKDKWGPMLDNVYRDVGGDGEEVISEKERAEEILNELEGDEGVWREFNLLKEVR